MSQGSGFPPIISSQGRIRLQVSEEVAAHLDAAGVSVKEYGAATEDIKALAAAGTKLWIDPAKACCYSIHLRSIHFQGSSCTCTSQVLSSLVNVHGCPSQSHVAKPAGKHTQDTDDITTKPKSIDSTLHWI